jgi:hypothetical protein
MSRREPDREYAARKESRIPYPIDPRQLKRLVGQRFLFYPAAAQHRQLEPLSSTVSKRKKHVLLMPKEAVYLDDRPVEYLSGNKVGEWCLVLAGCDLGNSGDGDRRTVWGRIEFPDLK